MQSTPLKFVNIILDRDGTVIEDRDYLCDPKLVRLTPGAGPALRSLHQAGCRLVLATNQSGIARGIFTHDQYAAVQFRLEALLQLFGVKFFATMMCPHGPMDACSCRKPMPGLWEQLQRRFDLAPEQSVMIGDKASDILFAQACGLGGSILVLTGYGLRTAADMNLPALRQDFLELPESGPGRPRVLARDLAGAVGWILSRARE